ncbi:MAG: GIY-YIG nuclease family protein [Candidatus Heimdallarchaeota archaeon]
MNSKHSIPSHFSKKKGTYVLIIFNTEKNTIRIGSLGDIAFSNSYYIYIGSALGPGGLGSRLWRHFRKDKKIHWHIDYFLMAESSKIIGAGELESDEKIECEIAQKIQNSYAEDELIPVKKFGSSDCKCKTHLFKLKEKDTKKFFKIIKKLRFKIVTKPDRYH